MMKDVKNWVLQKYTCNSICVLPDDAIDGVLVYQNIGVIDEFREEYGFLSNFYLFGLNYDGNNYCSSESAFQAMKEVNPADRVIIRICIHQMQKKVKPARFDLIGKKLKWILCMISLRKSFLMMI